MDATLRLTMALAAALSLAACQREIILPGERLDPLAVTSPDGPAVQGPAPERMLLLLCLGNVRFLRL